jgi:DNA recombination protein RmuC
VETVILIGIGVLATAIGIALGRYVWPGVRRSDRDALAKAQTEIARLGQECVALRSRTDQLDAEHKAADGEARRAGEEVARLTERVAGLTKHIEEQAKQNTTLETQRDGAASEAKASAAELARLTERESALTERIQTQTAQLAELPKHLTTEFEHIANRILKASATELSENSHEALTAVLDPLRERIHDFQKKFETTYDAEREVRSLKEQIKLIAETATKQMVAFRERI